MNRMFGMSLCLKGLKVLLRVRWGFSIQCRLGISRRTSRRRRRRVRVFLRI